jgi:hypothetical protein
VETGSFKGALFSTFAIVSLIIPAIPFLSSSSSSIADLEHRGGEDE